jgi:hypothetical protein
MSINITPKEFQRRTIGAANRHHTIRISGKTR